MGAARRLSAGAAREDPASMFPGANGIAAEPSPQSRATEDSEIFEHSGAP